MTVAKLPDREDLKRGRIDSLDETEKILRDRDLVDSIRRSRKARRRGEEGTSLEDARREILGEDG
jgi:hypothetical protein